MLLTQMIRKKKKKKKKKKQKKKLEKKVNEEEVQQAKHGEVVRSLDGVNAEIECSKKLCTNANHY